MMNWGTLAPEGLGALRRQQDLGLAAAVRHFNDASVPGLGALWFPAPLVWSVLAVSLAEELGKSALPIGNAIEALAMLRSEKGMNPRLRGSRKLQNVEDVSFGHLARRGVYVVQPFRMGAADARSSRDSQMAERAICLGDRCQAWQGPGWPVAAGCHAPERVQADPGTHPRWRRS